MGRWWAAIPIWYIVALSHLPEESTRRFANDADPALRWNQLRIRFKTLIRVSPLNARVPKAGLRQLVSDNSLLECSNTKPDLESGPYSF